MNKSLCCVECGEVVIKSVDGELKLRSKVTVFRNNEAFAICKGCGVDIPIPVSLDTTMMKSISKLGKLKLFIKK